MYTILWVMFVDIGSKIREARKNKGLSQAEVAQAANVAINSLRLYEANKRQPRFETLKSIAAAIGVDVIQLIGIDLPANTDDTLLQSKIEAIPLDDLDNAMVSSLEAEARAFKNVSVDTLGHALWRAFGPLNKIGKIEAVKRVEELTGIPKYRKEDPNHDK